MAKAGRKFIYTATGIFRLHARLFTRTDIFAELDEAIRPVVDLLHQALIDCRQNLIRLALKTNLHLLVMLRNQMFGCVVQGQRFKVLGNPRGRQHITNQLAIRAFDG
ncbi:hypothetical protein D9M69_672390 [compost metagenome]